MSYVRYVAIVIAFALSASASFLVDPYTLGLLISIVTYVTLVASWNIISGYVGYLFLGAAAFYGLGAYVVPLTSTFVNWYLAIPLAGVICFVVAFVIGIPFLRIRGPYFIIATYAFAALISNVVLYLEHQITGTIGRYITIQGPQEIYFAALLVAFLAVIVASSIKDTKFGLGLLSIKGNEDAAAASGVDTTLYKLFAFGVTALFMGMAGAAVIPRLGYIDNTIAFAAGISFNTLVMGVLGGAGSILGGVASAIILSLLFEIFFSSADPFAYLVALGCLLFVAIFFMPGGLGQLFSRFSVRRSQPKMITPDLGTARTTDLSRETQQQSHVNG
jgi:branched-chain amino acid transport system permease protein